MMRLYRVAIAVVLGLTLAQGQASIGNFCSSDADCEVLQDMSEIIPRLKGTNSSHITITFNGLSKVYVTEVLLFENLAPNLESISLQGVTSDTTLSCATPLSPQRSLEPSSGGLYFSRIRNISLTDITIEGCGARKEIWNTSYSSAVYFEHCTNIYAENVVIRDSEGTGLALIDNSGCLDFIDCTFENNEIRTEEARFNTYSGGSGVFVILNEASDSSVTFRNCFFLQNNVTSNNHLDLTHFPIIRSQIFHGVGGGMYLTIYNASNINVTIEDCIFRSNEAIWGGGLFVLYFGFPENNRITVKGTVVDMNRSYSKSGGGVDIGFLLEFDDSGRYGDNFMRFTDCNFTRNSATLYGGGVSMFSTKLLSSDPEIHFLVFMDCLWEGNVAVSGSAVDISPNVDQIHINGVYPVPQFIDCSFISNVLEKRKVNLSSTTDFDQENGTSSNSTEPDMEKPIVTVSETGEGTILITSFNVEFLGNTLIQDNTASGIYLSSGVLTLFENSNTTFEGNIGRNGGGLSIMTFGNLILRDNVELRLINNTALLKGGGIYAHSNDPHEYISTRNCFVQYYKASTSGRDRGILFVFRGNQALSSDGGNDVYSSSVRACSCETESHSGVMETFLCIGNVSAPENNFDLTTDVDRFEINNSETSILSPVVPGNSYYKIPVTAFDEYNTTRNIFYEVVQDEKPHSLAARSGHVSQNQLQFAGELNQTIFLNLTVDTLTISFNVQSSRHCPPGFVHDEGKCVCGSKEIFGIAYCNITNSFILHGFWIGFCDDTSRTICSSHCPLGFCSYMKDEDGDRELPVDMRDLVSFVCDENRTGLLCGQCVENTSTYYHSYMFRCGEESLCKLGMLFYALSELLPLTLMFFFIIIFDVKFTTGTVNGFIFYSQVLDSISIDANGAIPFPRFFDVITDIHRFIYRTLNFDFFSLESLSFCLWPNASSLDALAMKYVTVVYAFVLLILLIIFMNTGKCKKAFSCWRPRTLQSSAKHGITAFIVICYSQCARVSFQILSPAYLYAGNFTIERTVVFRRGDYDSFSSEHNRYAVPAIAVLLIISVVPVLLLLYPLIFKFLALLRLNDSKLSSLIWHLFPIPLMDSFQSSFKDSCRFFAGLYFLYRLLALAAWAYSPTLIVFYTFVEVQLIIVLALHSMVQPYKDKWHNIIDSLIFANLALINSFTLFNFFWVIIVGGKSIDVLKLRVIEASLSFQAILIYTPLLCVAAYFIAVAIRKLRGRFCQRVSALSDSVELPPLRVESEGVSEEYQSKRNPLLANYISESDY